MENKMKRILMLILVVGVILSCIVISLEGIPIQESAENPQKIKILLDIAGENDLLPLVTKHLLEAFSNTENVDVVLEIEEGVSYVLSVVLVEARAGENRQKTENIAACVQFLDYFDNNVLKPDVAVSNWERVDNLTENLIEHSQVGLYLFSKNELGKMTKGVVSKFQELFLEKNK
jgi:Na+-transporting NADH:ubiquinone oxidoreductase subunit NqrC